MRIRKSRPLLNCELTHQALEFIYRNGRNTLDYITEQMTVEEQIKAGWRRNVKSVKIKNK